MSIETQISTKPKSGNQLLLQLISTSISFFDAKLKALATEEERIQKAKEAELNKIKSENPFFDIVQSFTGAVKKAYPLHTHTIAISKVLEEFNAKTFLSVDELKEDMAKILFRIYFSEGKDKVYDFNKKNYYNDLKCQILFDNGIFIPEEWLHQLIRCLILRSAEEDMILHNLTPEWLWSKCFRLLMELYQLTNQSINTIRNG
ncbi:hypothetical protein BH10BAC1_BH10BAC1_05940 [soil metagenome]